VAPSRDEAASVLARRGAGGAAKFAGVPLGTYAAVLVESGARDRTSSITVPAGDGAYTTEFR